MKLIERYILGRIAVVFTATLVTLAGLVWITTALREIDVVTAKGQTLVTLVQLTVLALPFLVMTIAPFAFAIAVVIVLNSMNGDNELVVVNAAGASRLAVLRPVVAASIGVSLLMLAISTTVSPLALRELRSAFTKINVDLVTTLIRPGRFTQIEEGLTFHIKGRGADGTIAGLMIEDRRDKQTEFTYFAKTANVVELGGKQLLVMRDGTIQRLTTRNQGLALIAYESYGFDLTELQPTVAEPVFKPSERLFGELLSPNLQEEYVRKNLTRFKTELHDRLSQPLLPVAFAFVIFVFLGDARTTRQGRGMAIVAAAIACAAIRFGHFSAAGFVGKSGPGWMYMVSIGAVLVASGLIASRRRLELPRPVARALDVASAIVSEQIDRVRAAATSLVGGRA